MSLKSLQKLIGVSPDGVFGPKTLEAAMKHFNLTPARAAHFFGQCAVESANFTVFSENLNYGAAGLQKTFSKYFPTLALAKQYERQPEKIANKVYANRMGNGNEASGDGWKYRGRGAIQTTGKNNYSAFATFKKDPSILSSPDIVAEKYSFDSAIFFFDNNKLWGICDQGVTDLTILNLTKRVNGGTHGLISRKEYTKKFAKWLKI